MDTELGILQMKLNAEAKKRSNFTERMDDMHKDLTTVRQLLTN